NHRDSNMVGVIENINRIRHIVGHGGEGVGIEDQSKSSGSIFSNSSSMIRLMRSVSLCRCLRPPASLVQGFSEALECALNFSLTASVTNSRNGIPRSAARDFARRKMLSGISNVVFIYSLNLDRCSHIYGSESIARGSELVLRFFVPPSIRLLAVDIDGTLLNSQFHIAEGDINALQRAYDNGIEVILVTGRRHTFALPMARQLGFDLWLISSNGAITRSLTGETFHRDQLPLKTCRTLCHTMREFRGNMVITFDKESKGALVLESMDQL